MRTVVRVFDSISEHTGKVVLWAAIALVLVLCYEVTMRYVFDAPTNWVMETAMMLGGTIAALGWAYTHRHHGHVRVDVIYTHLSPRGKAIIDVVCSLVFLFPCRSNQNVNPFRILPVYPAMCGTIHSRLIPDDKE